MKRWQEKIRPPTKIRKNARENLIAHFNKLTVRDDLRAWIQVEVRWLLISASLPSLSVKIPPPEFKEWDAEAAASIKQFGKLATKLGQCLRAMPPSARAALFEKGPTVLGYSVLGLEEVFYKKLVEAAGQISSRPAEGGRPVRWGSLVAEDMTRRTAGIYELLTGKRAGPGSNRSDAAEDGQRNEFENLLSKVFTNLGIDASAEVQAKKLRTGEKTKDKQ